MASQREQMLAHLKAIAAAGGNDAFNALSEDQREAILRKQGVTDPSILRYGRSKAGGTFLENLGLGVGVAAPIVAGATVGAPAIAGALGAGTAGTAGTAGVAGATKAAGGLKDLFGTGVSLGDLAKAGIAGAGVIQSSKQQGKANAIIEELLATERAKEAQRGPLRESFVKRIENLPSQREDLGSLFASENPFANRPSAAPATLPPAGLPPTSGALPPLNPGVPVPQTGSPAAVALDVADRANSPGLRRGLEEVLRLNRKLRKGAMV